MAMKQFISECYDDHYLASMKIIIGGTAAEAKQVLVDDGIKSVEFDDQDGATNGFVWSVDPKLIGGNIPSVYLFWDGKYQPDLAHELFHLVHCILSTHGVTDSEASGEVGAYYIGYLYRCVNALIERQKAKKRKKK